MSVNKQMDNVQIKLIRTLKINFSINTEIQTRALLTGEKNRERVDIMCLPKKKRVILADNRASSPQINTSGNKKK